MLTDVSELRKVADTLQLRREKVLSRTKIPVLSGSTVTTAWRVLGLRIEDTASRYGGWLRMYWISSRGEPTVGGLPDWVLGGGLTTFPRKTQYLLRITTHSLGLPVAGCCECGDEPLGSCVTESVRNKIHYATIYFPLFTFLCSNVYTSWYQWSK
jgi:hypothetical protein